MRPCEDVISTSNISIGIVKISIEIQSEENFTFGCKVNKHYWTFHFCRNQLTTPVGPNPVGQNHFKTVLSL